MFPWFPGTLYKVQDWRFDSTQLYRWLSLSIALLQVHAARWIYFIEVLKHKHWSNRINTYKMITIVWNVQKPKKYILSQWMPMKQSTNTGHLLLRPLLLYRYLPSSSSMLWQDRFITSKTAYPNKVASYSVSHVLISQCFHFWKKIKDHAHERYVVVCKVYMSICAYVY